MLMLNQVIALLIIYRGNMKVLNTFLRIINNAISMIYYIVVNSDRKVKECSSWIIQRSRFCIFLCALHHIS